MADGVPVAGVHEPDLAAASAPSRSRRWCPSTRVALAITRVTARRNMTQTTAAGPSLSPSVASAASLVTSTREVAPPVPLVRAWHHGTAARHVLGRHSPTFSCAAVPTVATSRSDSAIELHVPCDLDLWSTTRGPLGGSGLGWAVVSDECRPFDLCSRSREMHSGQVRRRTEGRLGTVAEEPDHDQPFSHREGSS